MRPVVTEMPDVVRLIGEWRSEGRSCAYIALELNLRGVPAMRGGKWHPTQVRRCVGQYYRLVGANVGD